MSKVSPQPPFPVEKRTEGRQREWEQANCEGATSAVPEVDAGGLDFGRGLGGSHRGGEKFLPLLDAVREEEEVGKGGRPLGSWLTDTGAEEATRTGMLSATLPVRALYKGGDK